MAVSQRNPGAVGTGLPRGRIRPGLLSLLLLVSLALPAIPGQPVIGDPAGPTVEGQEAEGLVERVDPQARTITLDDGQEYVVPPTVMADAGLLG